MIMQQEKSGGPRDNRPAMIAVTEDLLIPDAELTFTATRSSGPGGQHVNKASTRVTLLFDVAGSPSLSEGQRARILERLATRVSREGILRVVSQQSRSQEANRRAAVEHFVELVRGALKRAPARRPTRATAAARDRRILQKKERGRLKRGRGGSGFDEE